MSKVLSLFLVLVVLTGCSNGKPHESLAGFENLDNKNNLRINDYEQVTNEMKSLNPGIYVFATAEDKSSHILVPAIDKVLKEHSTEANYIDLKSIDYSDTQHRRVNDFLIQHNIDEANISRWPLIVRVDEKGDVKIFTMSDASSIESQQNIEQLALDINKMLFLLSE